MIRVLLTAAIYPQSNFRLNLVDPEERAKQYATALRKWCGWASSVKDTKIVFVENSGADLDKFVHETLGTMPKCLDVISAPSPPADVVARGKGASESLMIDLFTDQYADDPDETLWVKATGRLYVNNLSEIIPTTIPDDYVLARLSLDLEHADARVFGASAKSWRKFFVHMDRDVDEVQDFRLEHVIARRICQGVGSGAKLGRFLGQPKIEGVSGTWQGRNYSGARSAVKRQVAEVIDYALRERLQHKHY